MRRAVRGVVEIAILTVAIAGTAVAQSTVVVTPSNPQGWGYVDQKGVGSAAITTTQPRSGNGSLEFTSTGGGDKAYFGTIFSTPESLSSVSSASFDWYRSSTSTTTGSFAPSFHFLVASNNGTTTQYSELVWERAYNEGGTVPTDQWVTEDMTNGNFWRSMGGPTNTNCQSLNQNGGAQKTSALSDWLSTCYANQNAMVYGVSVGFGSGWTGTFNGFVDNVSVGFAPLTYGPVAADPNSVTYNFEADVTTTPEPSSLALLGTGLFGLVPMIRRRRR